MALREEEIHELFASRDKLEAALTELCDFIDRADLHELEQAHRYQAYIDASALLLSLK